MAVKSWVSYLTSLNLIYQMALISGIHVLQLALQEEEKLCFVVLADFCGVNTHIQANNRITASLQNSCKSTNRFS